jgi:hypothetical protein
MFVARHARTAARVLDAVGAPDGDEADLLAIVLWARLHLLALGAGDRQRVIADLERLEALATRPAPGQAGWGLGRPWDAFNDDTVNPPETIYTFQTALIGLVLLDAHAALDQPRWHALALEAAGTVIERACCWEHEGGLSVWYSDQANDQKPHLQKHDVNALAAGLLARLGDGAAPWRSQRHAMVAHLLAEQGAALPEGAGNQHNWRFGAARKLPERSILHRPSDLLHQCLILIGLQEVREPGASLAVERALDAIVATHFDRRGVPAEGVFTRGVRGWGPPAALFALARSRSHRRPARRIAGALARSIGGGGVSSMAPLDEPRAQAWFALALARQAASARHPSLRRAASA